MDSDTTRPCTHHIYWLWRGCTKNFWLRRVGKEGSFSNMCIWSLIGCTPEPPLKFKKCHLEILMKLWWPYIQKSPLYRFFFSFRVHVFWFSFWGGCTAMMCKKGLLYRMFALNFVDNQKIRLSWGLALDGSPNTSKGHKSFFNFP